MGSGLERRHSKVSIDRHPTGLATLTANVHLSRLSYSMPARRPTRCGTVNARVVDRLATA